MVKGCASNALFDDLKSKPALHSERRSPLIMLMGSALVAYGRFDRRGDADIIASGLRGGLAGIPPHLPNPLHIAPAGGPHAGCFSGRPICGGRPGIGLGTLVEAPPAGLPPALGALLDIDRRVAIEDVRD